MPLSALALAGPVFSAIKGIGQKSKANKLKQSDFDYMPPGLLENKALDQQQAYSRQAPGTALAAQQAQRAQANTIAAGQRMYGGDTNKMGAVVSQAQGAADNANAQNAVRGQQFSENAFGRLRSDNSAIGAQQRQNYNDYWDAKSKLLYASDQNIGNAINNASVLGQSAIGGGRAGRAGAGTGGTNYNSVGYPPGFTNPFYNQYGNPQFNNPYINYSGYGRN